MRADPELAELLKQELVSIDSPHPPFPPCILHGRDLMTGHAVCLVRRQALRAVLPNSQSSQPYVWRPPPLIKFGCLPFRARTTTVPCTSTPQTTDRALATSGTTSCPPMSCRVT